MLKEWNPERWKKNVGKEPFTRNCDESFTKLVSDSKVPGSGFFHRSRVHLIANDSAIKTKHELQNPEIFENYRFFAFVSFGRLRVCMMSVIFGEMSLLVMVCVIWNGLIVLERSSVHYDKKICYLERRLSQRIVSNFTTSNKRYLLSFMS